MASRGSSDDDSVTLEVEMSAGRKGIGNLEPECLVFVLKASAFVYDDAERRSPIVVTRRMLFGW